MKRCSVCGSVLEAGSDFNKHIIPETCVKKLALRLEVIEKMLKVKLKKPDEWRGGHD